MDFLDSIRAQHDLAGQAHILRHKQADVHGAHIDGLLSAEPDESITPDRLWHIASQHQLTMEAAGELEFRPGQGLQQPPCVLSQPREIGDHLVLQLQFAPVQEAIPMFQDVARVEGPSAAVRRTLSPRGCRVIALCTDVEPPEELMAAELLPTACVPTGSPELDERQELTVTSLATTWPLAPEVVRRSIASTVTPDQGRLLQGLGGYVSSYAEALSLYNNRGPTALSD